VEYVQGENMSSLTELKKAIVDQELQKHLATLRALSSNRIGGPGVIITPLYRVQIKTEHDDWKLRSSSSDDEYVFFVTPIYRSRMLLLTPDTLKINAIIDWEYAGFFPAYFEYPFYNRLGPFSCHQRRDR
jgi:hypothetical protein